MGVLVDVLYLINIPRLLTPRRRAPIANYLFICVAFVTTLFFTLIYFSEMLWEHIVFILIFVLLFLIVFYNISKNKADLEDESIDYSIITTERDRAETETKIVDLERKMETASLEEKLRLRREVANLRQENAVRELEEERVFDTSLVKEIRDELKTSDKTDLDKLTKKEFELQNRIEELEKNKEKDRDVAISNEISALMARQKNIQDIKNRKTGYASIKQGKIKNELNTLDKKIQTYNDSLSTLQVDKKELEKKLKSSKGDEKKKYKNQLDSVESAIGTRKEEIELEKRKRKVLEEGRIDNLRGIDVYNKGANTVRAEAVANDGLVRLIEKNRLKRKATKADREVLLRAQNRVDAREMQQETLDLGLAYASGRDDTDVDAGSCWVQLQEENYARLTAGQEYRKLEELSKQEAVDLTLDRIEVQKFEKQLEKIPDDNDKFYQKYGVCMTDNQFSEYMENIRGALYNYKGTSSSTERNQMIESSFSNLFNGTSVVIPDLDANVSTYINGQDDDKILKLKTKDITDAEEEEIKNYLESGISAFPVRLLGEDKKTLRSYKKTRDGLKVAEENRLKKVKEDVVETQRNKFLSDFNKVKEVRKNLVENGEEIAQVYNKLGVIGSCAAVMKGNQKQFFKDLGIDVSDGIRTADEMYSRGTSAKMYDSGLRNEEARSLAAEIENNATATYTIIDEIRAKNDEQSSSFGLNDFRKDISKRLRYNAVKRSLNRIENDAIGVSRKSDLRGKVAQIQAPVLKPALAGAGLAAASFALPTVGTIPGAVSLLGTAALTGAGSAVYKNSEAIKRKIASLRGEMARLKFLQQKADKTNSPDDIDAFAATATAVADATLDGLNDF